MRLFSDVLNATNAFYFTANPVNGDGDIELEDIIFCNTGTSGTGGTGVGGTFTLAHLPANAPIPSGDPFNPPNVAVTPASILISNEAIAPGATAVLPFGPISLAKGETLVISSNINTISVNGYGYKL